MAMKHVEAKKWLRAASLLAVLCVARFGWAQGLTEEQYQKLNIDILQTHQAEFASAVAASDFQTIANAYNATQAPPYWVWKTSLSAKTIYEETDADGGIFDWATHMAQTQQERAAWDTMFFSPPINPSLPQTRGAFTKIYSGNTSQQQAQKAHLLAISRRPARRIEALLIVTGSGNGSGATPSTMGYEGVITYSDVNYALTGTR